jgi:hypothetical protein
LKPFFFFFQNILAAFAITALYIFLFCGFMAYERIFEGKTKHFIPMAEVDFETDAVWKPGQGDRIRAQDLEESKMKRPSMKLAIFKVLTQNFFKTNVD